MDTPQTPPVNAEIGSRMGVRFYRYRGMLKRYWWVLLITIGIGLVYEGWVLLNKQTRFVSAGKLMVRESRSTEGSSSPQIYDPSWYGTIKATITSPSVLDRAKKRSVLQKPELDGQLEGIKVTAENDQGTYIFTVNGSGEQPANTQFFVGMVMDAFMEQRREEARADIGNKSSQLKLQAEQEAKILEEKKQDLEAYAVSKKVPFIEDERLRISTELSDTKKDREQIAQKLNTYKFLREGAMQPENNGAKRTDNEASPDGYVETKKQLAVALAALESPKARNWKPAHPGLKDLQQKVKDLQAQLDVYKELAGAEKEAAMSRLAAEFATKEQAIADLEKKAQDFSVIAGLYQTKKAEVDRLQAQNVKTLDLLNGIVSGNGPGEILAISQAASVASPEPRNVFRHLLTGLLGGLLIGLVVLFLLDRADDRLASSSEMIEQFSEPILGQIPDVADSRTNQGLPLLQDDDERFMFSEAFRSLRSSLIFMPNQKELKTLIITSAIPNEGKSTVASNLAITMANAGARVLLVDADLRRGDIAALFDTDGRQGLSNILRGEVPWKACVQNVRGDHLHIIPRGPVTNQSGELLLKPIVPKLLDEWKAAFDLVIFNTAPILATDDTPTLAPNFDGTLMVIRASFTSARLTRNSLNALYQRQVNVLGLIMNCVDTELPDYYYYRYPKYYAA